MRSSECGGGIEPHRTHFGPRFRHGTRNRRRACVWQQRERTNEEKNNVAAVQIINPTALDAQVDLLTVLIQKKLISCVLFVDSIDFRVSSKASPKKGDSRFHSPLFLLSLDRLSSYLAVTELTIMRR